MTSAEQSLLLNEGVAVGTLPLIVLGVGIFTCGFFSAHAIASSWVGHRARTGKAQASSLYLFCYYQGSSISGTLGGMFWQRHGWRGGCGHDRAAGAGRVRGGNAAAAVADCGVGAAVSPSSR